MTTYNPPPARGKREGMAELVPGVWYDAVRGWFNIEIELSNDGPSGWEVLIGGTNPMECTACGYGPTPGEALQQAMGELSKMEMIPSDSEER